LKTFSRKLSAPEYLYGSEIVVSDKAAMRHFELLDKKFVTAGFENLTVRVHVGNDIFHPRQCSFLAANDASFKRNLF
jgi:hypothetical protein